MPANLDPIVVGSWRDAEATIHPAMLAFQARLLLAGGPFGSRVHFLQATNIGATAQLVTVNKARRLTVAGAGAPVPSDGARAAAVPGQGGNLSFSASTTLARTSGSWLADGWRVNDRFVVIDPANAAVSAINSCVGRISAVTALTMTVATMGSTAYTAGEAYAAATGVEVWRLSQLSNDTIAINAGNNTAAALDVLSNQKPGVDASPDRFMTIGPNAGLILVPNAAITAACYVEFVAKLGDY
jgi:hypothetical protein